MKDTSAEGAGEPPLVLEQVQPQWSMDGIPKMSAVVWRNELRQQEVQSGEQSRREVDQSLADAYEFYLGIVIGSTADATTAKGLSNEKLDKMFVLVAALVQSSHVTHGLIYLGYYAKAAASLRQDIDYLASINQIRLGTPRKKETVNWSDHAPDFAPYYGELSKMAHGPSIEHIESRLSTFPTGVSTSPQVDTNHANWLLELVILLMDRLADELLHLLTEAQFDLEYWEIHAHGLNYARNFLIRAGFMEPSSGDDAPPAWRSSLPKSALDYEGPPCAQQIPVTEIHASGVADNGPSNVDECSEGGGTGEDRIRRIFGTAGPEASMAFAAAMAASHLRIVGIEKVGGEALKELAQSYLPPDFEDASSSWDPSLAWLIENHDGARLFDTVNTDLIRVPDATVNYIYSQKAPIRDTIWKYAESVAMPGEETMRVASQADAAGKTQLARTLYERIGKDHAGDANRNINARGWHNLGTLQYEAGEFDAAVESFGQSIETGELDVSGDSMLAIGRVLTHKGDRLGAMRSYLRAIETGHPDHSVRARLNLALMHRDNGNYKKAEALLREVIKSGHPDQTPLGLNNLGTLFLTLGRIDEARVQLQAAVASEHHIYSAMAKANLDQLPPLTT